MYKRGDCHYSDFWYEGQRYRKSWGPVSKSVAGEKEGVWKRDIRSGRYFQRLRRVRFDTLAEKYLEYAKVNKKPSTVRRNKSSFEMLKPHFKAKLIGSISPELAEQYKKTRLENDAAPSTINRDIDFLRCVVKKAVEWGYLIYNPLATVKHLKEDNEKMWVLTPEQEEKLLEECDKRPQRRKYLRDLVLFALNTGMRLDEIFSLEKRRVHLKDHYAEVVDTKTNQNRNVPLNEVATEILKRLLIGTRCHYVFSSEKDKKLNNLTNAFWQAVAEAGLIRTETDKSGEKKRIRFRFHDLRHTFGSRLGMAGQDLKTIMEIMGHKTHKMAMRYQHPTPDHKLAAVRILEKSPPKSPPGEILEFKKEIKSDR